MRGNPNDTLPISTETLVKVGSSITVTIGRNVGETPMGADHWLRFRADVVDQLATLVKPGFTFTYEGQGEWNGVTEDSAAIVLGETSYSTSVAHVDSILSALALTYGQDAIGWTAGPSRLSTPS